MDVRAADTRRRDTRYTFTARLLSTGHTTPLDSGAGINANGTLLVINTCIGATGQRWTLN